ncbi:MAG: hypothetical protein WB421_13955 [Terriglobales bacterium]
MKQMVPVTTRETQANLDKYIEVVSEIPEGLMDQVIRDIFAKVPREQVELFIREGLTLSPEEKEILVKYLRDVYIVMEPQEGPQTQ